MSIATISVVIPTYNMQASIAKTLKSLEEQSFKLFEVIIVDDGSTDCTENIVREFMRQSKLKIKYHRQNNQGVSAARNKGIELCSSKFIAFCDADDMLFHYTLGLAVQNLEQYDVVAGYAVRKIIPVSYNAYKKKDSEAEKEVGIDILQKKYLYENASLQFSSFFYKLSILNRYNIRFSTNLKYGEDEEFTWKYLCHCHTAIFLKHPLYYYTYNTNSASNNISYLRTQVIDSIINACKYYRHNDNDFYKKLEQFGIPRAKLAILKQFALNKSWNLFYQLSRDSNYKCSFKTLICHHDIKVSFATLVYLISPKMFYYLTNKLGNNLSS